MDYEAEYKKAKIKLIFLKIHFVEKAIPNDNDESGLILKWDSIGRAILMQCNQIDDIPKIIKRISLLCKLKILKMIFIGLGMFLLILLIIIVMISIIMGLTNGIQSVGENSTSKFNNGATGSNSLFSTLCEDCDMEETSVKTGVMSSDFYKKMSEMMNLYNALDLKKEERQDEFDFTLLSKTVQYGKIMSAELFKKSANFGTWIAAQKLTNKDIESYPNVRDINNENAQKFFKWAAVMIGTPYSLPDINLRGLSGSLITGKLVTTCVEGNDDHKDKKDQIEEAIKNIVLVEQKFSGEKGIPEGFWNGILSFLGLPYTSDNKVLSDRLEEMFKDNPKYDNLKPFVNLDYFDPEVKCPAGNKPKHTYSKFMNYEQYKVYLEKVFVPQNYVNCDECILKNASDNYKTLKIRDIIQEIFDNAEYYRSFSGMNDFKYDEITYGTSLSGSELGTFSSPLKGACNVTSPYAELRGNFPHKAVDTTLQTNDLSLYAIADGIVDSVTYFTNQKLYYDSVTGTCPFQNGALNSGIRIVIKHQINGINYYASYNHLAEQGIVVTKGSKIKKGQKIANMGTTGCSTGNHLHFALYKGEFKEGSEINPTVLFKQCNGSDVSGLLTIATTDNYVYPEKCSMGKYSLDEVITGMIKKTSRDASKYPEYIKATAVAIRTKLMNDTNWCEKPIREVINVDIKEYHNDLIIYSYVIDTQGMVLNYSGEILDNVDYVEFPCEKLSANGWNANATIRAHTLRTLGLVDTGANLDIGYVDSKISEYNKGCVYYNKSNGNVNISVSTIPDAVVKYFPDIKNNKAEVFVPESWIKKVDRYATAGKMPLLVVRYLASIGKSYTEILNQFYQAKTVNLQNIDENKGVIDISTSPGLLDAKKILINQIGNNSQKFTYGETLRGTGPNSWATGEMSQTELDMINAEIEDYINKAEQNAIAAGDINPQRARVLAAAYWMVNNEHYKMQYTYGISSNTFNFKGWNPKWSQRLGIECSGFVVWSFVQAGANYRSEKDLQNYDNKIEQTNANTYWTTDYILRIPGIKIGDIMNKRYPRDANNVKTGNGHWGILFEINMEDCYIVVADHFTSGIGPKLRKYVCGQTTIYNRIFNAKDYYQDASWEANRGS